MDGLSKWKLALGIFYVITAIVLFGTAYFIMIKRFKRNKLDAINTISLITSRQNIFKIKTQFLVLSPSPCSVKIDLLDEQEKFIETLLSEEIKEQELPFDFDPTNYESGKYYLSLTSESAKILRSITIAK
jgi:hypothetical protein